MCSGAVAFDMNGLDAVEPTELLSGVRETPYALPFMVLQNTVMSIENPAGNCN